MKVLILRFSSLGDIVLTTPVIRALKSGEKDVEVHYCTKAAYSYLLASNPYVDKVHALSDSLWHLIDQLRQEKYDHVIDLHNNLRTMVIKAALGVRSRSFSKLNILKWLMVALKINRLPNIHIVDRYMKTIEPLGFKNDNLGLDYFIPDKDQVERDWLPETHQRPYVVYALGGKFNTKKLPLGRMIELCDKINQPVILLGGPEDKANGDEIEAFFKQTEQTALEEGLVELNKKTTIFNGCGKFNVNQSASIIKNAKVVFTHDTGMMHIAAAFKKRIYSIWGNTIPEFGMYPYKTSFVIFENKKLNCRPCSKIGYNQCPRGHFRCMNDLTFDFYIP